MAKKWASILGAPNSWCTQFVELGHVRFQLLLQAARKPKLEKSPEIACNQRQLTTLLTL